MLLSTLSDARTDLPPPATSATSPAAGHAPRRLRQEHDELEQAFRGVRLHARIGEWRACNEVWTRFSEQLEQHMQYEEEFIFPRYEGTSPAAAECVAGLRREHAAIRRQLETIGVEIQLHLMRAEGVERFLDELRDHVEREGLTIYPYLQSPACRDNQGV